MKSRLYLIVFLLCIELIYGQIKIFRTISVEDGLLQSNVNTMLQDANGYIWFGTSHGLSRWDGLNFTNYHTINGLAGARINFLFESVNYGLLIGTDNGLSIFKNNKFTNYSNFETKFAKEIISVYEKNKIIYIGTFNGLYIIKDNKLTRLKNDTITFNRAVHSIIMDDDNNLFFVVNDLGMVKYSNEQLNVISSDNRIMELRNGSARKNQNNLYFSTTKGYCKYNNGVLEFVNISNEKDFRVRRLIINRTDHLAFATNQGAYILKDGKIEIINTENGLANNIITSIFQDINGIYYFGISSAGIAFYDGGKIFSLKIADQNTGMPFGLSEGANNEILIATSNNGINIFENGEIYPLKEKENFPYNYTIGILKINNNQHLISSGDGLLLLENKKIKKKYTVSNGLLRNFVRCMTLDKNGDIYLGTFGGIHIMRDDKINLFKHNDKLPSFLINELLISSKNELLVATEDAGLIIFKDDSFNLINEESGLANNKILSLFEDDSKNILIGTQGGLSVYDGKKIRNYTTLNGLSDNTIYGIKKDNLGNIYLITNKGVNILKQSTNSYSIRYLTYKNGLAGDECNTKGIFKDSKGRMWFSTLKGVSCYDPSKDLIINEVPKIHISEIRLFETQIVKRSKFLEFEPNENYLKFYFWGVNLSAPEQVQYQYRLTEIDPKWVDTESRFARYAQLAHGKYKFEVRARYIGGEWSEPESIEFIINTPFYKTWWFIIFLVFVIAATISFIVYFRIRQIILLERLRTKLAADLHDNIGAGLSEISILSEVISFVKDRNIPDITNNLNLISKTARELVDNMSDIVWLVNPKKDSLYDLIIRLEEVYREIFLQKGISIQSKNIVVLESISLSMEFRQHLFLLFKEAMNNILKHSECKNVILEAKVESKKLIMILSDNGKGFDNSKKKKGYGIDNMHSRAKTIDGNLIIESSIDSGTKIIFEGKIN